MKSLYASQARVCREPLVKDCDRRGDEICRSWHWSTFNNSFQSWTCSCTEAFKLQSWLIIQQLFSKLNMLTIFFVPGPSTSPSAGQNRRSTMYKTMWSSVGQRWSGIFFTLQMNYHLKLNCNLPKKWARMHVEQGGGEHFLHFRQIIFSNSTATSTNAMLSKL